MPTTDRVWLCLVVLTMLAGAATPSAAPAEQAPKLAVLGAAADGRINVSAPTTDVSAVLTIESLFDQGIDVTVRTSPLRDAQGRSHDLRITQFGNASAGDGARTPAVTHQKQFRLEPGNSALLRVTSSLAAEGEYIGEVILLADGQRKVVQLVFTRGLMDLGVEILGIERTSADFFAAETTLRLTLAEQLQRSQIVTPVLIEHARKDGEVRIASSFNLTDDARAPLKLDPGESKQHELGLAGFEGAGEYTGKLRFSAVGMRPKDVAFTVIVRQPAAIAFLAVVLGVGLSLLLRRLAQYVRPRVLQRRRLLQVMLGIEKVLSEVGAAREESSAFEALHQQCESMLGALEREEVVAMTGRIDLVQVRTKLAGEWMVVRRGLLAAPLPELRERFRGAMESVQQAIERETSKEQVAFAVDTLQRLPAEIDAALKEALQARIQAIRNGVAALRERAASGLAARAQAEVVPLLEEADGLRSTDLQRALRVYIEARERWAGLLFLDLEALLAEVLPLEIDSAALAGLREPLIAEVMFTKQRVAQDVDGAMRQYESVLARYIAGLSDLVSSEFEEIRGLIQAAIQGGRPPEEIAPELALLAAADTENQAARRHNLDGNRQLALVHLSNAIKKGKEAELTANGAAAPSIAGIARAASRIDAAIAAPETLGKQPPQSERELSTPLVLRRSIRQSERTLDAIDGAITVVALLIASFMGISALWTPDPTWGGWQDFIVAVLWGLGLHQLTFAGVASLRAQLTGAQAGAAAQ